MNPSKDELLQQYCQLSDDELLSIWNKNTLTEYAHAVLSEVIVSRGINTTKYQESGKSEPESGMINAGPLVTLTTYFKAIEAHILRTRLEAEDIPAYVFDEHIITANWFLAPMMGGVRVQVPQAFLPQARKILQDMESGLGSIEDDE